MNYISHGFVQFFRKSLAWKSKRDLFFWAAFQEEFADLRLLLLGPSRAKGPHDRINFRTRDTTISLGLYEAVFISISKGILRTYVRNYFGELYSFESLISIDFELY